MALVAVGWAGCGVGGAPPREAHGEKRMRVAGGGGGGAGGVYRAPDVHAGEELLIVEKGEDDALFRGPTREAGRSLEALKRRAGRGPRGGADPDAAAAGATQGTLFAKGAEGKTLGEFPLKRTDVAGEITGFLASTRVTQTFANPYRDPIEAVYVFPLPETAAVNDFLMAIGERRIRGIVRPRAEAERIYAEARARGYTASLLTQERPNIFTQNVANIAPGGEVKIEITYFHTLKYEAGEYEYVFPMVVGPRYIPGNPAGAAETVLGASLPPAPEKRVGGGGTSPDTDRVPDASRITPPVLAPGERSGHDIAVRVELEAGVPIQAIAVPTHDCVIEREGTTRAHIALKDEDAIPNRDFVLRFRTAGAATEIGLIAHRGDDGGFFTLMMQPPLDPRDADVTPREVTFLIDKSGSQSGLPLAMSKDIVKRVLERLRPEDRFNVMYFESGNGQLFERPVARTVENVAKAKAFVDALEGGGGTNMLEGLARALREKRDPKYLGMIVFLTDGYIGNDDEILRLVKEERGSTRVFVFGTGSSVNRSLLEGIAESGGGKVEYALPRDPEHAERCVKSFFAAIDAPVLCDISIDWGGLPVADIYPAKVNDLFTGQPIVLKGRYTAGGAGTITVRGRVGARSVALPLAIDLPAAEPHHAALGPVWARARIADLSLRLLTAQGEDAKGLERAITDLACEFRLVSQFTSFVAVDASRITGNGRPVRVLQPVELPEGVSYEGALGARPVGKPVRIAAWGLTLVEAENGNVIVVDAAPPAAGKVAKGEVLATCDRVLVRGLGHLESLVLQGGRALALGFRDAERPADAPVEVTFPAP
jgi:Ca-activated chloride channel family protein